MLIMLVLDVVLHAAIVVAIASSAFVVFVMPHSNAAGAQRVIGGHVVAVIVAAAIFGLEQLIPPLGEVAAGSHFAGDAIAVVSVGLSIFIMVLTNTEHPPAAGTVFGLVVGGWAPSAVVFVLLGAVMLSVVHFLLRPRMTNLL